MYIQSGGDRKIENKRERHRKRKTGICRGSGIECEKQRLR
jgi:hypothetical protein